MPWTKKSLTFAAAMLAIALPALATLAGAGTVNTAGNAGKASNLILPAATLARSGEVPVIYKLSQGFTGHAVLHVRWTDSLGRVVEDQTLPFDLLDETEITFPIDMSHAVAMSNHLEADLSLNGTDIKGKPYVKQETAEADFIARPPFTGWKDFVIMMWQNYPANLVPDLKKLGINGGVYFSTELATPDFLIDTNTRWYAESLALEYYSEYHRWRPDRGYNWSFEQAQKLYQEHPDSLAGFKRHPSFQDPYWRKLVHDRGVTAAKRLAPYRPYFYSLADEPGIAAQAAPWDFDFSDQSLAPMRRWLRSQYGSLGALNQEWGTHFTNWNLVMPMTTNQAMQQPGDNFSAWADFKNWMDISFADALKIGADAIREGDPHAYVSIGGGQMPGWGGFDYARLAKALTAIEPYDIGRSVDIAHSLDPAMSIFTTIFASGPQEEHRVWHELLHGNRGLILWDEKYEYVQPDGQPGPRGKEVSQYYNEIRDGEGALIINSHPVNNRIAIHYSQASMRTQWMLQRRPDGAAWMTRGPEYEPTHSNFMRLRTCWSELIEDQGLQLHYISYDQLAKGDLLKSGDPVLVLPESSSLSQAIRRFIAGGGIAIANGVPGTYDQHSKKRPQSSLADLFGELQTGEVTVHTYGSGKAILLKTDVVMAYLNDRLEGKAGPMHRQMEELLRSNGVQPQFTVEDEAGDTVVGIDVHVFANGGVKIIALESNPEINVKALGPPDFRSNERFAKPVTVHLHMPHDMYLYDTRAHQALGQKKELILRVDPYSPTLLTASDTPLPEMQVSAPQQVQRGSVANIAIHAEPAQADTSIFHIDVLNPNGEKSFVLLGESDRQTRWRTQVDSTRCKRLAGCVDCRGPRRVKRTDDYQKNERGLMNRACKRNRTGCPEVSKSSGWDTRMRACPISTTKSKRTWRSVESGQKNAVSASNFLQLYEAMKVA